MSSGKRKHENLKVIANVPSKNVKKSDENASVSQDIKLNFKSSGWGPMRKTRGQVWPKLKKIYQIENYSQLPPTTPSHANIEAPPSLQPPKRYCDITGFQSRYTHPTTGIRFANAEVYKWIVQNLTTFESQQEILAFRGVETRIK